MQLQQKKYGSINPQMKHLFSGEPAPMGFGMNSCEPSLSSLYPFPGAQSVVQVYQGVTPAGDKILIRLTMTYKEAAMLREKLNRLDLGTSALPASQPGEAVE